MKKIFLFVGPSGCGKTTMVNKLAKELGLSVVNSYTDRPRRSEDEEGHTFLSPEEFDKLKDFVAYTQFAGHRYGVTSDMIDDNDLYVIDVAGVKFMKDHYKGDKEMVVFYFDLPEQLVFSRMVERGDDPEEALKRIYHDRLAFRGAQKIADFILPEMDYAFVSQMIRTMIDE